MSKKQINKGWCKIMIMGICPVCESSRLTLKNEDSFECIDCNSIISINNIKHRKGRIKEDCKHVFKDLVYVNFGEDSYKIIGEIMSHRITDSGMILYNVDMVDMYVPPTMIHLLTDSQKSHYYRILGEYQGRRDREEFIKKMQDVFKDLEE